mgnify:CR=1 FL=1
MLRFLLVSFLSLNILAQENSDKEFIELYLKIQNLEKEIATLRNEIEVIQTQLDFYQEKNIQKINEIDSKLISLMSIEDLQKSEAVIRREELIPRENIKNGDRLKAYCYEVKRENKK